ncbi:hypothetical protein [Geodermatophilus sp. URMC 64]
MTTRRSSLQDELLADLRTAAPIPVTPAEPAEAPSEPATVPAERRNPTFEMQVTPLRWARPKVAAAPERGAGLLVSAGPLRIQLSGLKR